MKYVGIYTQQRSNSMKSLMLLIMFPVIMLGMVWVFLAIITKLGAPEYEYNYPWLDIANEQFISVAPWVVGGVAIWFAIAYAFNTSMIQHATGARPLERRENPRVYNIVENLCMTCGMDMPKVNVIIDPQLNAFASGINKSTYTVTVTTGLLNLLNDEELAGVIGHELTHIRNKDTQLLITSIIFVGIVSTVMSLVVRMLNNMFLFGGGNSRNKKEGGASIIVVMLVAVVCSAIAYLFIILTRFAISRKREYMADAGGAELCGNPRALASALRKISGDPGLGSCGREDVAQLFIIRPEMQLSGISSFMGNLFSTHPDTRKRIQYLEQF